ncbi:neuropeptides capa receptor-like [Antedon mediterranea]|uniref:neuropeptides capa receptor-like n=1 Tax=Antedon mediterranea TaxID=105859 RepID=UPI003AF762B6
MVVNETGNWPTVGYDVEPYLYTEIDRWVIGALNPVIIGIGVIGNFITILVLTRCPRMQTSLNVYLTSLAIADMLFLLMAPIIAWQSLASSDIHDMYDAPNISNTFCKINNLIIETAYQVGYLMILCISVERFLAICRPLQYRNYGTRLRAAKICCVVWLCVLIYQSRLLLTMTVEVAKYPWPHMYKGQPNVSTVCSICSPKNSTRCRIIDNLYTFDIVIGLLVILILIPLYATMIRRLRNSRFVSSSGKNRRKAQDLNIFRTVLLTVSIFALCFTPYNILNTIYMYFEVDPDVVKKSVNVFRPLMYLNAAVNPVIYNMTNTLYRQSFIEFFCCCRKSPTNCNMNSPKQQSSLLNDSSKPTIKSTIMNQSDESPTTKV